MNHTTMLQIDERMDEARIRQFAAQVQFIPRKVRRVLDEMILKDQGPEFYHGQLAAIHYAHQAIGPGEQQDIMACIMAIIADHIIEKGWW